MFSEKNIFYEKQMNYEQTLVSQNYIFSKINSY